MTIVPESQSAPAVRAPSDVVRHFNRFELKYIVRDEKARGFGADLAAYMDPDPHSGTEGYPVHSIYWDSPDLVFFWEKIDGEKYRRKLRFRAYRTSRDVFVEIKQRIDRTVQKRRTLLPLEEAERLFGNGDVPPAPESEVDDRVLKEALFLCRYHDLRPRMGVGYRRQAWIGRHEHDLRVTFDRRLQLDGHGLELGRPFRPQRTILDPDRVVIEIKFCHRVPLWLTKLTSRHALQLTRISKYCSAVDAALFGGRYT